MEAMILSVVIDLSLPYRFYGPFWILCIVLIATLIFVSCVVHRRVSEFSVSRVFEMIARA